MFVFALICFCFPPFLAAMNVSHEINLLVEEIQRLGSQSESILGWQDLMFHPEVS